MVKFARDVKLNLDLAVLAVTTLVSILLNMAYGFLAGMAAHYIIVYIKNRHAKNSAAGG